MDPASETGPGKPAAVQAEPGAASAPAEKAPESSEAAKPAAETGAAQAGGAEKQADAAENTESSRPVWPELADDHPLAQLFAQVAEITSEAQYSEVYGITLDAGANAFATKLVLQKFLRANANDVAKARAQLVDTLRWRKTFQPLQAMNESFDGARFGGLGCVTTVHQVPGSPNPQDVVTFNLYGKVQDNKATFGDVDGFLRWRCGLMELSVQKMGLAAAKTAIPDYGQGADPYQGIQVHDYGGVSFLRMDADAKRASRTTIDTFQKHYPELLSRKFFVNVPAVMAWVYSAIKLVVAKETAQKFTVLSSATQLAGELGPGVPPQYGGKAWSLEDGGETLKLSKVEDSP